MDRPCDRFSIHAWTSTFTPAIMHRRAMGQTALRPLEFNLQLVFLPILRIQNKLKLELSQYGLPQKNYQSTGIPGIRPFIFPLPTIHSRDINSAVLILICHDRPKHPSKAPLSLAKSSGASVRGRRSKDRTRVGPTDPRSHEPLSKHAPGIPPIPLTSNKSGASILLETALGISTLSDLPLG